MTEIQNWKETLKQDGIPERLCNQFRPACLFVEDPIYQFMYGNRKRGTNCYDPFGTEILFPEDAPGAMPHVTADNKVCPDVTRWREYVKFPDLDKECPDWSEAKRKVDAIDRSRNAVLLMMTGGIFEQLHFLMGFEDTLMNFYEEPEAMGELIDAIAKWRFHWMKLLVDHLQPDIICSHDDWGSKHALFMSPDMWREFFKDHYEKFYRYQKEHGVITMHHADSYLEPIVEDMAEIHIDIWQGVLPSNDIPALQKRLKGRMVLMGGIDASIVDRIDSSEEEIRAETRRACEAYGPGGHFIPSMTYGRPGSSIYPKTYATIEDEIERYNRKYYKM